MDLDAPSVTDLFCFFWILLSCVIVLVRIAMEPMSVDPIEDGPG